MARTLMDHSKHITSGVKGELIKRIGGALEAAALATSLLNEQKQGKGGGTEVGEALGEIDSNVEVAAAPPAVDKENVIVTAEQLPFSPGIAHSDKLSQRPSFGSPLHTTANNGQEPKKRRLLGSVGCRASRSMTPSSGDKTGCTLYER